MDKELFEVGADVDVEALMARIREGAKKNRPFTTPRFAEPASRRNLQPVEVETFLREIHRGSLLTEVINQIPLKQSGWKGKLELRIKKFLKWVVHWNTKAQADFNHSTMRSLGLIAQHLQTMQRNFVTLEAGLKEESVRRAEMGLRVDEQIGLAYERLEELAAMARTAISRVTDLEGKLEHESQELRQELNQQLDERVAQLTARLEETGQRADAALANASGIEQKVSHDFDEIKMKILRVVRTIRTSGQPAGTAESQFSNADLNLYRQESGSNGQGKPRAAVLQAAGGSQDQPFDYFLFEHKNRGPISDIKRRQSAYLESFLDTQNVVDLGCGRGECVELLSENDVQVTGVDNNQ